MDDDGDVREEEAIAAAAAAAASTAVLVERPRPEAVVATEAVVVVGVDVPLSSGSITCMCRGMLLISMVMSLEEKGNRHKTAGRRRRVLLLQKSHSMNYVQSENGHSQREWQSMANAYNT